MFDSDSFSDFYLGVTLNKVQNLLDYSVEDAKSAYIFPIGHTYPRIKLKISKRFQAAWAKDFSNAILLPIRTAFEVITLKKAHNISLLSPLALILSNP